MVEPKGKARVKDSAPLNTPKATTIVSSVRLDGTTVPKFLSGVMNGSMFLDYIQHELVRSLHAGDLVVMDNLRCHKVKGVKEAIIFLTRRGTRRRCIPVRSHIRSGSSPHTSGIRG